MNLPLFISRKTSKPASGTFSATIHKVAVISISLGLAAMILAFFIMLGFQNTIKKKVYDFTGHIHVTRYILGNQFAEKPAVLPGLDTVSGVSRVQPYAIKYGLLQNDEGVEGIIFKGIDQHFDIAAFAPYLVEGKFINLNTDRISNEIVVSKKEATKMALEVGNEVILHFIQDPPRTRRLKVVGIYQTGMEDFDDKLIIGDLALVRRLNNWADDQAGGFEVFVDDPGQVDKVYASIFDAVGYDLYVQKSSQRYLQIFEWLSLINNNVNILIFMVLFVASFNMISIVLILILERTPMVGTLKAVGASDTIIRRIFVYSGVRLILRGLLFGNILGLGLAFIQYQFKVFPLDPNNYYMSYVPIEFNAWVVVGLNLLVFLIVSLVLYLPTLFISRIQPIMAIRFD